MKKFLIITLVFFSIIFLMFAGWDLFVEIESSYKGLEFLIPLICRREVTTLSSGRFFDEEKLEKLYLTRGQAKRILKKIKNNDNWIYGDIDEKLFNTMNYFTREHIYTKIPYVENKYWIFTNRCNEYDDRHNVYKGDYYSVSFGLFDVDNNILYYYEYAR